MDYLEWFAYFVFMFCKLALRTLQVCWDSSDMKWRFYILILLIVMKRFSFWFVYLKTMNLLEYFSWHCLVFEFIGKWMLANLFSGSFKPNEEGVSMLQAMGFSRSQCIKALQNTDNNVERAADWIFSHPDEINSEDISSSSAPLAEEPLPINDGLPSKTMLHSPFRFKTILCKKTFLYILWMWILISTQF